MPQFFRTRHSSLMTHHFPRLPVPVGCPKAGFTLLEVLTALVILSVTVLSVTGAFRWAEGGLQRGAVSMRALALVESTIEAKRQVPWDMILGAEVDGDGVVESTMRDDGAGHDLRAGDGIYSNGVMREGIMLVWTVRPDRPGPLRSVGLVAIVARASFHNGQGRRQEIEIGTLRANPNYIGK